MMYINLNNGRPIQSLMTIFVFILKLRKIMMYIKSYVFNVTLVLFLNNSCCINYMIPEGVKKR